MATQILKDMPKRTPLNGTFELTIRCNLKCRMCLFRHHEQEYPSLKAKELSTEEWISLGKQVADAGTLHLLITGGEPMLRPDFCEIWKGLYKLGFVLQLYTNATLITPRIIETLKQYPPHQIGVTIYGASAQTYEKVCGNGKAFEKMLEGVKQLKTLPSVIEYRTTIIKDNKEDLSEMEKMVSQVFESNQTLKQTDMVLMPVRGGCAQVKECRLSPKENVYLFFRRSIEKMRELVGQDKFKIENVKFSIKDKKEEKQEKGKITLFGCNAGMNSYTVSYDGQLLGCQLLEGFSVNLRKEAFYDAWQKFPFLVRGIHLSNEHCMNCENREGCWSCVASRYAETGSYNGKSEYVCQNAKEYMKYISR